MSVREKCGCGAEFESDQSNCVQLWREWRADHRCVVSEEFKDAGGALTSVETVLDPRYPELRIGFRGDEEE